MRIIPVGEMRFLIRVLLVVSAVTAAALFLPVGCIVESICASDTDCPFPQQCREDGSCGLECSASTPERCTGDRPHCLVSEFTCVECLDTGDCTGDDECVNHSCVPSEAPDFTLVDDNPTSPTFGDEIALSDYQGSLVLLFFAGLG